jgi:RNA polymerase sigma-70 factor, ECF subfamily
MTPALSRPTAGPPDDAVRRAAADPDVGSGLRAHAAARLLVLLPDRAARTRSDLVEEAVQVAVQRALARAAEFDPDRGTPAGWLHGILNNVLSEQHRAARKQPVQPASDPARWDALAVRLAPEAAPDLADLIDALPADQRRIVRMSYLDGMSHGEIAARMGISEPVSRVRLSRALTALRRLAAGKGDGR